MPIFQVHQGGRWGLQNVSEEAVPAPGREERGEEEHQHRRAGGRGWGEVLHQVTYIVSLKG